MLHLGSLRSDAAQRRTVKADASSVADWARRFEALGATAVDERLRAFYAQGLPAGDTGLADVPLLAMDFETTGLDPQQDEIVSIGIVPMTLAHNVATKAEVDAVLATSRGCRGGSRARGGRAGVGWLHRVLRRSRRVPLGGRLQPR